MVAGGPDELWDLWETPRSRCITLRRVLRGPLSPARAAVVREAIYLSVCEIRWMVPEKLRGGYEVLPSGYVKIAIENRHFEWANSL